jgi:SAM-dependent methyltransferase
MHKITEILCNHYSSKYMKYGATSQGVDWGSDPDLSRIRQEKMLGVIKDKGRSTLLDVGCGYGHMAEVILKNRLPIDYAGIDVVGGMIEHAKKHNPEFTFYHGDFLAKEMGSFDYVVCNGILTQKLSASTLEMNVYAQELIASMYSAANKGVAFNIMNTHVNFQSENLYYRNPIELLAWCTSELTPHLIFDSSYRPWYEYTIYLYKPEYIKALK